MDEYSLASAGEMICSAKLGDERWIADALLEYLLQRFGQSLWINSIYFAQFIEPLKGFFRLSFFSSGVTTI